MSVTRAAGCPGPDLLLLFRHGLLEGDEKSRLETHFEDCAACNAQQTTLGEALEPPPVVNPPPEVLEGLRERIAEDQARERALPDDAQVRLLCTYCKDDLPAPDTIYCASCVAAYHEDCFYEHGRCAAPGCEGTRIVRSAEAPIRVKEAKTPERRSGRGALLIALGVVLGGGAVAALVPGGDQPSGGETLDLPPAPDPTPGVLIPDDAPPEDDGPEVLDMQDIVDPPDAQEGDTAWKEEYKRVLGSRTVTLNFPETPFSEVVEFLQDITGMNIVVSAKLDPEEILVTLRVRDILLEDALAVILEQARLSAVLENQALVIVPLRVETLDERMARIASEGIESPEWAFDIRRRLESQQITLSFDETPLSEAVDFLRDITGLNYVVKDPGALEEATVSLRLRDVSLRNAIDLMLGGHDLGIKLANGVLWIVPRKESTEGRDKAEKKQALLSQPCEGEVLREGTLADLVTRLKAALGDGVHVVLSNAAKRSKARLILPGAGLTVKDALDLAKAEADATHVLAWLAEGDAVIVLDTDGPGLLAEAAQGVESALSGAQHNALLAAQKQREIGLRAALAALDALADGEPTLAALKGSVEAVRVEHDALTHLERLSSALKRATTPETFAATRASVNRVIAAYQAKDQELRTLSLANDARGRATEQLVVTRQKELEDRQAAHEAKIDALQREADGLRSALDEAMQAADAPGAGPEEQKRLDAARRAVAASDDASLELARAFDTDRRRLQERKQSLLKEMTRNSRDHALQTARLESERGQLKARMQDLVSGLIVVQRLRKVDAVLKAGGSHPAVDDYAAWGKLARAQAEEAYGKSFAAYGGVGVTLTEREGKPGLKVDAVEAGSAAEKAGLKVGDVVDWKSPAPEEPEDDDWGEDDE